MLWREAWNKNLEYNVVLGSRKGYLKLKGLVVLNG